MFFDPSEMLESKRAIDYYREFAGEITNSYLSCGTPPTETLMKIAQSEELQPHQIELLAGEANKAIHNHKFASAGADEKYFAAEFPLADAKQVIASLQHGSVKIASSFVEPKITEEGPDAFAMFGVTPPVLDKTAETRHDAKRMHEKLAMLNDKIQTHLIIAASKLEDSQHKFIKMARQCALEDSSSKQRLDTIRELNSFVKQANVGAIGTRLMAKVAYVLGAEGMIEPNDAKRLVEEFTKQADQTAPAEMINERIPAKIINGTHPLYITLKTVADDEADYWRWHHEGKQVDDKLKILGQKIRAL